MANVGRRLSVVVCAEMVGYSRLANSDAVNALTAVKAHCEAIDPIFAEEGGRVVENAGDRTLLEFPSAFEAVCAALRVQRLLAERNAELPSEHRLIMRIGIHLGDVTTDALAAALVETAAQLQETAEPGGICISQAVQAAIHRNIDALFRTGGARMLRSVAAPTIAYNLALPMSAPVLSLVVLPFVNLSEDARWQELVVSITENLTSELARIDRSAVVDRETARAYRGDPLDIAAIGAALGVRYVIKGSVRDAAGRLRVNAELIDAETGEDLWIDRFEMVIGETLAMQRDAVARLLPPLHAHLLAADGRAPAPPPQPLFAEPGGELGTMVLRPRGLPIAANVRAPTAAPASAMATVPEVVEPEVLTPRRSRLLRNLIKVLVVIVTGVLAIGVLGARRGAIVEALSWMLVVAGAIQIVGAIAEAPPEG